jgi:hypothetical protein
MEQHPVPQHISSYQFRLIGEMTVRQFGFLAGGCVTGLLFYASPLAGIVKWPLIAFFVFMGVALAFMPVQERPLDQWILAFIKAVFSPTQFTWKKQPKTPDFFKTMPKKVLVKKTPVLPPDEKKLAEYLGTLPVETTSPLDQQEESSLKKTLNLFQLTKMPTAMPSPKVTPQPVPSTSPAPPVFQKTKPKPLSSKPLRPKPTLMKKKIRLPEAPVSFKKEPSVEAKFSSTLPFPEKPERANTLVGMVLDPEGKIMEGAIIEIRDNHNIPVRALKTNKLGQFRSVTPLENGEYEMEIEKPGFQFDLQKIKLTGAIVEPLEIRAKGISHGPAQNP